MITTRQILLALSAAALTAPASAATVIDFNELRPDRGRTFVNGSYESDGFRLSSSRCSTANACFITPVANTNNIDRVGAALVNFVGSATISLERIDGGLFTLESLVLASNMNNAFGPATQNAVFNFNLGDGTTITQNQTITSVGLADRNLLSFGNVGALSSFSFTPSVGSGGFLQFDDITVSQDVAAAVPEPGTWAMMLLGFGAIGFGMRRRKSAESKIRLRMAYT